MPSRRIPKSASGYIRAFRTAGDIYRNTPVEAQRAIGVDLFNQINEENDDSFATNFIQQQSDIGVAEAARGLATGNLKVTFERLSMFVSHFHQVLDMAIQRGDIPAGSRGFYDRDIAASAIPIINSYDDVDELARTIVSGELRRHEVQGAAFIPMALPSAVQIETLHNQFTTLRQQSQTTSVQTNTEQEEVQALMDTARNLVIELWDTVEFFYRHDLDPASRRAKCALWGVIYESDPGETPPPATNPTPPQPQ